MKKSLCFGAVAAFSIGGFADAAITFFTNEALFNQALADAGKVSKGIEDFEQAILPPPPNNVVVLNDPLNINNLQGLFPRGDFINNLTFQSNLDNPGVNGPNPRGVGALVLFGPGLAGSINVSLLSSQLADSFDIISGPPAGGNHTALGMHGATNQQGPFPVDVRVFDKNEQQIGGPFEIVVGSDVTQFLGILATGGDTIGRVNLSSSILEGVFDVQTYLPDPCPTDINGDGATDVLDLIDLLLQFGQTCP